jgi:glycosyltransferase involved in cell wall biosynthesis
MLGLPGSIVHSHNLAAQQYSAAALCGTAVKHIHTEHGTNPHFGGLKNRLRTWLMMKMTDRVVAVSEDTATALGKNQKIPRSKLLVIRNGVTPYKENNAHRSDELLGELGIDASSVVIGSIGRLAYVKGYDLLLAAFAKLCGESGSPTGRSSAVLLLVGDGPERTALEDKAKGLGVENQVVFAGYREDVAELLNSMDLFVLTSRSEGLSISLLEAMSAGVPVLVTDVGENAEVLNGGECGVMLPADETAWPDLIAEQLRAVIGESKDEEERVQRAKERVSAHYSQTATMDAYEREYLALVQSDSRLTINE